MGDSNSDEYRAEDSRGGKKHPALNWVEQLALSRDINFGPWGTWGEPRRTGYKYNWARSSATTRSMITSGQHTGLAKQVAAGEVSHVVIYIGGADFHLERGTYEEIYNGSLRGRALQTKIDTIIAELTLAVDTLQDAGDVRIVIVSYIDKGLAPETLRRFPNPIGRSRVSKAVQAVNDGIAAMAEKRQGVAVADMNEYGKTVLSRLTITGHLDVGGEQISVLERGHEPHHMQLADRSGHFGTVASGLLANVILVEPFNRAFGLNIEPLSDLEILQNAGLR